MTEINRDKKVEVKSLCGWDLYFDRIVTNGTVKIPAKGKTRLSIEEIEAQVFDNNVMFIGEDGEGSHARIYINDKEVRTLLGFEGEDAKSKQKVLDSEEVGRIINLKTASAFEKNLKEKVKTRAEMNYFVEESKKQGLNDYSKIKLIEEYTGFKFDN